MLGRSPFPFLLHIRYTLVVHLFWEVGIVFWFYMAGFAVVCSVLRRRGELVADGYLLYLCLYDGYESIHWFDVSYFAGYEHDIWG